MPKLVDHDVQRAALLDGAFALLARRGVDAVGMREIARELGVSTGTLYHYFPSKEALFEQMLLQQCQRDLAEAESVAPAPLAARLQALRRFVLREREHFTHQALVTFDVLRRHPDGAGHLFLQRLATAYREGLAHQLGVSLALAELVSSAVDGLMLHHLADPKGVDLETVLRLLSDLLLAHHAAKSRGRRHRRDHGARAHATRKRTR